MGIAGVSDQINHIHNNERVDDAAQAAAAKNECGIVDEDISAPVEAHKEVHTSVSTVKTACEFADRIEENMNKTRMETQSKDDVDKANDDMSSDADRMSEEDASLITEQGMSLEKFNLDRLSRVLDAIKMNRQLLNNSIRSQASDLKDMEQELEKVGRSSMRQLVERKLKGADLPATLRNIDRVISAYDMSASVLDIDSKTKAYLVEKESELTIENVYKASHSAVKRSQIIISEEQYSKLSPQIDKVINETGIDVESARDISRWLLENDLPITSQTITKVYDIEDIKESYSGEAVIDAITDSMNEGIPPVKTSLLKIRAMMAFSMADSVGKRKGFEEVADGIHNLREIMLKSLSEEEFGEDVKIVSQKTTVLKETMNIVFTAKESPDRLYMAQAVTVRASKTITFESFGEAMNDYENMMTVPRADMGDSIKKAFANIPDMLKSQGIESSETNIQAAKMLGYAGMEINEANVVTMREYAATVEATFSALKPAVVVDMIKQGENPLDMTFEKLQNVARETAARLGQTSDELYSEYLYRLDKTAKLNESEREAYIGIYRLIRAVEQTDGAAVATSIKAGRQLTMANLLSSVRTLKSKGIDVNVDDEFGSLDRLCREGTGIDEQIMAAASDVKADEGIASEYTVENGVVNKAFEHICTGKLEYSGDEELYTIMNEDIKEFAKEDADIKVSEVVKEQLVLMQKTSQNAVSQIAFLNATGMSMTLENIYAAGGYLGITDYGRKDKLSEQTAVGVNDVSRALEAGDYKEGIHALDDMFEELSDNMLMEIENAKDNVMDGTQMKGILEMANSVRFLRELAARHCYQIPVADEEGNVTNVNLTFIGGESSKVSLNLESEKVGKLKATFSWSGKEIKGLILSESVKGADTIREDIYELENMLHEVTGEKILLNVARMPKEETYAMGTYNVSTIADSQTDRMDTESLCKIASKAIEFFISI